ncbi:MAG: hypothetical protein ACD_28C00370G0001, partial [uncultured bacterium]
MSGLSFSEITLDHLEDIATLHSKVLSWSPTGKLGRKHVRDLYQTLFESQAFFGFTCYLGSDLIAFVTATTDYCAIRPRVQTVFEGKILEIGLNAVFSPIDFLILFESRFCIPKIFRRFDTSAEWLTLISDPQHQMFYSAASIVLVKKMNRKFLELGFSNYL